MPHSGRPGSPGRRGTTGFKGPPGFVGRPGIKGKGHLVHPVPLMYTYNFLGVVDSQYIVINMFLLWLRLTHRTEG